MGRLRAIAAVWVPPVFVGLVVFGCGGTASRAATSSSSSTSSASTSSSSTSSASTSSASTSPAAPPVADVHVTAASFRNLTSMTPVRGFFVANLLGQLPATLAVARANRGGVYPVGTLLQLVPQEAMVKHRPGWNAQTSDWEFFSLDVSATGTKIITRGVQHVVNRFGGNCASCHEAAKGKFDFVCEHDHGCAPLPISDTLIHAIQLADPRPSS